MFRHVYSSVSSANGSSTGYQAPLLLADVSLIFFNFLHVGVLGSVEFAQDVSLTPELEGLFPVPEVTTVVEEAIGPITVFQGPQFFLGPTAGFHFGG